jgi:hypothetical protein
MQLNHNKNAGRDLEARFARAVVTARLGRHDIVCPGSRRILAIETTYPAGAAPMWRSLPGPAAPIPAGATGATSQSNPGPRPPIPQGPGLDRRT